jgi:hypothetical protein
MDGASLDRRSLRGHTHSLITIRVDGNGVDILAAQVLDQAEARPFIFDEESVVRCNVAPAIMLQQDGAPEIGKLETGSYQVDDVDCLSAYQ